MFEWNWMDKDNHLGREIRRLRKRGGETQVQMAEACDMSNSFLSDIERGVVLPSLRTANKIANHFHMSLAGFLVRVEPFNKIGDNPLDTDPDKQ